VAYFIAYQRTTSSDSDDDMMINWLIRWAFFR